MSLPKQTDPFAPKIYLSAHILLRRINATNTSLRLNKAHAMDRNLRDQNKTSRRRPRTHLRSACLAEWQPTSRFLTAISFNSRSLDDSVTKRSTPSFTQQNHSKTLLSNKRIEQVCDAFMGFTRDLFCRDSRNASVLRIAGLESSTKCLAEWRNTCRHRQCRCFHQSPFFRIRQVVEASM
jgi:hypothetical protein